MLINSKPRFCRFSALHRETTKPFHYRPLLHSSVSLSKTGQEHQFPFLVESLKTVYEFNTEIPVYTCPYRISPSTPQNLVNSISRGVSHSSMVQYLLVVSREISILCKQTIWLHYHDLEIALINNGLCWPQILPEERAVELLFSN